MRAPVLAIAKARSLNVKIGACATTYAAQPSCPTSCPFLNGGGCYAENGGIYSGVTRRLNAAAALVDASPLDVAIAEADAIDAMRAIPGRPLRLHTVGDCRTAECAELVAAACDRYRERGGGQAWTYTHAWRLVPRQAWGSISVLASCESPGQAELATGRGYATALVVPDFPGHKLYALGAPDRAAAAARPTVTPAPAATVQPAAPNQSGAGARGYDVGLTPAPHRVLPCPQISRGVLCSDCRLCFDSDAIRARGYSIGFSVHGTAFTVKQALRALAAPHDPRRRLTSRQLIPEYLAEHPGSSDVEVAAALGIAPSSVWEMRHRLNQERSAA